MLLIKMSPAAHRQTSERARCSVFVEDAKPSCVLVWSPIVRVRRIKLDHFRRFTDLEISEIPETSRLVILAGPNGCGKSSFFDALNLRYQLSSGRGWTGDQSYYSKPTDTTISIENRVEVEVFSGDVGEKGAFYFRSAYRNDPEFALGSITRLGPAIDDIRFRRMIESDTVVSQNYQRLASQAMEDIFDKEKEFTTVGEFREKVIGDLKSSINRMFPDLILNSLGNPLEQGTFRFNKGASTGVDYKNLSGGEKAAFDLILDLIVKRSSFPNAVYCIDEPEAHMNTRLQGALLKELYTLVPEQSQLWVATHSIGMMRAARELNAATPGTVSFIDFGGHDFDSKVVIQPSAPSRRFWESVLSVALDDLVALVAPEQVIVCEGNPAGALPGKNAEHDATIYNTVFGDHFPGVKFIAGGNAKDVASDRLGFVAALPNLAAGMSVKRLIDRDDHAPSDVVDFEKQGITTLGRRHLEAYVYDDEVLTALCQSVGQSANAPGLLADKVAALADSVKRGNAPDDIKSAAGVIYIKAKQRLGLIGMGNDQMAFARNTLAPLIVPEMAVFGELRRDVFGS